MFNIQWAELRSKTKRDMLCFCRNSYCISFSKSSCTIMHNAVEIIGHSQWVHMCLFVKIILISRSDIFMVNLNIFVSVWTALFMPKTKNMTNFMNCCWKRAIVANGDWLDETRNSSHIRKAAIGEVIIFLLFHQVNQ